MTDCSAAGTKSRTAEPQIRWAFGMSLHRWCLRSWIIAATASVAVWTSACESGAHGDPLAGLIVYGQISGPGLDTVPMIEVEIGWARADLCRSFHVDTTTADTGGYYSATILNLGLAYPICLHVVAATPDYSYLPDTAQVQGASLGLAYPYDSVKVDLQLIPAVQPAPEAVRR